MLMEHCILLQTDISEWVVLTSLWLRHKEKIGDKLLTCALLSILQEMILLLYSKKNKRKDFSLLTVRTEKEAMIFIHSYYQRLSSRFVVLLPITKRRLQLVMLQFQL